MLSVEHVEESSDAKEVMDQHDSGLLRGLKETPDEVKQEVAKTNGHYKLL